MTRNAAGLRLRSRNAKTALSFADAPRPTMIRAVASEISRSVRSASNVPLRSRRLVAVTLGALFHPSDRRRKTKGRAHRRPP